MDDKLPKFSLKNLDDIVAAATMAALILLMFVSIVCRYIFSAPLMWAEEVIALLFIWAIMIGAMSAQKVRGHLSVDLLVVLFRPRVRALVGVVVKLVFAAVLVGMMYYGWLLSMEASDKITNMLSIPYTYLDLAVPVGSLGMLCYLARDIAADARAFLNGAPQPLPSTDADRPEK